MSKNRFLMIYGVGLSIFGLAAGLYTARAQLVFSNEVFFQDFNSSTVLTDYIGAGPNLFDGITTSGAGLTWDIFGGGLRAVRTGNAGSWTINSKNFQTTTGATAFNYRWSMTFSGITASSGNDMTFAVGNNLSHTANAHPANADTHSDFRINLTDGSPDNVTIRNDNDTGASDVATYTVDPSRTVLFSWFINNSGSAFTYVDPSGGVSTLNNDANSIWTSLDGGITWSVVSNNFGPGPSDDASNPLNDFKFVWQGTGSNATVIFDNIGVYNVPEPSVVIVLSLVGLFAGVAVCRRRRGARA